MKIEYVTNLISDEVHESLSMCTTVFCYSFSLVICQGVFRSERVASRSPRTRCKLEVPCYSSYDEWLTVFEDRHRSVGFARILSTVIFWFWTRNGFRQDVRHIESIEISIKWICTWETCRVSLEYWCRQRLLYLHEDKNMFLFIFLKLARAKTLESSSDIWWTYLFLFSLLGMGHVSWFAVTIPREDPQREKKKNGITAGEGKTCAKCPFPVILGDLEIMFFMKWIWLLLSLSLSSGTVLLARCNHWWKLTLCCVCDRVRAKCYK